MSVLVSLLTQRFDSLDQRVDELTEQVKETNGQVRRHADRLTRVEMKGEAAPPSKLSGEDRSITRRDVIVFAAGIAATYAVAQAAAWAINLLRVSAS